MMKRPNNKGQLGNLETMIISLVVVALVLVVGFLIMAEVQDQIVDTESIDETNTSTYTTGYNASQDVQGAIETIPGWLPIIVIIVVGALLIGLVSFLKRR
jgi:uncharacterized protein (UPF0333 family)